MSTVFILGAGASYGDDILARDPKYPATPTRPPLIYGFFCKELFESIHYKPEQAEEDYPDAFHWIRSELPETDDKPVGEPPWDQSALGNGVESSGDGSPRRAGGGEEAAVPDQSSR